jgi:hypothetical protein
MSKRPKWRCSNDLFAHLISASAPAPRLGTAAWGRRWRRGRPGRGWAGPVARVVVQHAGEQADQLLAFGW